MQNDLHNISRHSHRIHVTSISTYIFWSFFDFLCQISKVNIPPHGSYFKGYLHNESFETPDPSTGLLFRARRFHAEITRRWLIGETKISTPKQKVLICRPKNWKVNKQLRKERRRHKNSKCNSIHDQILGLFSLNIPIHRIHVWYI